MAKPVPRLTSDQPQTERKHATVGEIVILFALISLLAGEQVPGVNESHYLPKAKHLFDRSFCAKDLFFESHDSHGLAAALAGFLSLWVPLTGVAWIGRVISWLFLAWAWQRFRVATGMNWIVGVVSVASWYFAIDYGNWAGEWAVGGFEGKSLAYPCAIMAFAQLFREKWNQVWIWLGLAVAWHPLAGGWAGLSFGIAWLCLPNLWSRFRAQAGALGIGTALGLVGVIPAGLGLNSPNQVGNLVASQIHVYKRLAHHQCPTLFAFERHIAGGLSLAILIAISAVAWWCYRSRYPSLDREKVRREPVVWLLTIAWIAVLFSAIGLGIDRLFSREQPIFASQLLRFYWFRWSDIVVPLAWTVTFWKLTESHFQTGWVSGFWAKAAQGVGGALLLLLVVRHVQSNFDSQFPAADQLLINAPVTRKIETDRYVDWLAVCDWASKNSPQDSLWFTPEHQQTFKWYAGRAEVVCWKDVPQDNSSVRKWYERIFLCRQPRNSKGERVEWTSEQILELAKRYDFEWVLVDRATQVSPLQKLEIMYPTETLNKSFAIFRVVK